LHSIKSIERYESSVNADNFGKCSLKASILYRIQYSKLTYHTIYSEQKYMISLYHFWYTLKTNPAQKGRYYHKLIKFNNVNFLNA